MNIVSARVRQLPWQPIRHLSHLSLLCSRPQRGITSSYSQVSKPNFLQKYPVLNLINICNYSVDLDEIKYEEISSETLETLTEVLEELTESEKAPQDSDVLYSTGVLTFHLGSIGTYVINKQTPNKQIWLSSPFSGPKRYDFVNGVWVYKHNGETLHHLLSRELSKVFKTDIDFSTCAYGGNSSD